MGSVASRAWALVVLTVVALPFASAIPILSSPLGQSAPSPTTPTHHEADDVPEHEYNWSAFYNETPTTDPPIVINGLNRPANDPLIIEGHVWNHRDGGCSFFTIDIRNSQNIVIRSNEFYWDCVGVYIENSSGITVETNYFQDQRGSPVLAVLSTNLAMRQNVIQGIQLWMESPVWWEDVGDAYSVFYGSTDVTFEQNRVQSHQVGVASDALGGQRSSNIRIHGNIFEDMIAAIEVVETDNAEISHNLINGFIDTGVNTLYSTGVIAHNNTFVAVHAYTRTLGAHPANVGWSAFLFRDSTATLRNNDMWANWYGYVSVAFGMHGFAVFHEGSGAIDARGNWWGSPAPPGVPPSGAIRGQVSFILWSLQPHHPIPPPPQVTRFDDDHPPPCPEARDSRLQLLLTIGCPVWPFETPTP